MASGSEEGHLSSRPLSRAPLPRPCTGPGRGRALGVTWEGRACRTWTWTPPGPLQNSRPHSRRPVAWPGQSLMRGNLGRPKSKSARFIQESSAERFLRVGGGSRRVSQESNNRSSYCGSLRRCAVSTPGLAHTCPFLAYVWSSFPPPFPLPYKATRLIRSKSHPYGHLEP